MFGAACSEENKEEVTWVLNVQNVAREEKYLGLPTPEGRMGKERFKSMKEKLAKRFDNWNEKFMSAGAKEVLIKSVAQAIPTYTMGVFKIPDTLCDELERMIRYFWWGDDAGQRKIHWLAWDKLMEPKGYGGMGFRDLRVFNQALLARQAWRLIEHPTSLCATLLKARYYPNGDLIDTVFSSNASPTWRAIEHGLELLKKGLIWRIDSGSKVQIWRDNWIPRPPSLRVSRKKGRSRL